MNVIDPGTHITVGDVRPLREKILAAFAEGSNFALDFGRIERIDAAGVQLIVSVLKECAECGLVPDIQGLLRSGVAEKFAALGFIDPREAMPESWSALLEALKVCQ